MTDRDLGELFHRAVATLEPRTEVLVPNALRRGMRLRRRRRIAQVSSGVALTGLIAAAAIAVWPSGAATTGAPAGASRIVPLTPQVLLQRTIELLPNGSTADYRGKATDSEVIAALRWQVDGRGTTIVVTVAADQEAARKLVPRYGSAGKIEIPGDPRSLISGRVKVSDRNQLLTDRQLAHIGASPSLTAPVSAAEAARDRARVSLAPLAATDTSAARERTVRRAAEQRKAAERLRAAEQRRAEEQLRAAQQRRAAELAAQRAARRAERERQSHRHG